jgi:tRNA pseudouridine65 synthase
VDALYRDDRLIIVNKPSGVAVHRGWADDRVTALTLARDLAGRYVFPVHRLDRGTSGALLFALDAETAALLQERLGGRAIEKRYLALVRGVTPEDGRIDHAIPRAPKGPRVDAITSYRRLAVALDRYSLVEALPETGRFHQIRRHMKHISHPVIGDANYGDLRENRKLRAEYGLARLALHARSLSFVHPWTGAAISVRAPLPEDLAQPLTRLGLGDALP